MTSRSRFFTWTLASVLIGAGAETARAQKGEAGVSGGGSFFTTQTVTAARGTGEVGFENGFSVGGWIGHNLYRHLSGEIHYNYERNDLKLSSGGTKVTFAGQAHAVHYDVLIYGTPTGSRVRPYGLVGVGAKQYRGTGTEAAFQPLSTLAILTKTKELQWLATFGGGVKVGLGGSLFLRLEFRDYMTRFPQVVIAPVPGAAIGGWIHNLVGQAGVGFTF